MRQLLIVACATLTPLALAGELAQLYTEQAAETGAPTRQDCAPAKPVNTPGVAPFPQPCPQRAPAPVPDIRRIGLERTRCLASCSAYTVIIQADGSFRYVGEAFVERMGEHTGTVPQGMLEQVFRYIAAIDYMSFEDSYRSAFLDNATAYTMVEMGGRTKVIQNYAISGPATLWGLEELIDELLEAATWDEAERER